MRSLILTLPLLLTGCQLSSRGNLETPFSVRSTAIPDAYTVEAGTLEVGPYVVSDPFDGVEMHLAAHLGLGPATEISLDGAAYVDRDDAGDGLGDTRLAVKHRFLEQDDRGRPSWAFELSGKLPTGEETRGLSTGEPDLGLGLIASRAWKENWVWWGYRLGFLGSAGGPGTDLQHELTMGGAREVQTGVGGFFAANFEHQPELSLSRGTAQVGGVFALNERWQAELAFALGFGQDAEDERIFVRFSRRYPGVLPVPAYE